MLRYACPNIPSQNDLIPNWHTQAERDPEEEGDYMAFEQLMAEAMQKKGKDEKKKKKSKHGRDSPEASHTAEKPTA